MSAAKSFIWTVPVTIIVFIAISWPLPVFWSSGIPSSAQNIENPPHRYMIPGDHLQLLYHFDLVRDQITGRIPFFHNPYEFNLGNDAARFRPGGYFMPMSGVYAMLSLVLGQASAWNVVLWLSVLFSAWFTWLWLRRFTDNGLAVGLGLLVVLVSPFRWISLFGGSPSGIALMWLPLLALSLDSAVRIPGYASGFMMGLALLLLYWGDIHVFYFGVLASPLFFLLSRSHQQDDSISRSSEYLKVLPGMLLGAVIIAFFYWWRHQYISASTMAGGRNMSELAIYSPPLKSLLFGGGGKNDHIFIGFMTALTFSAGTLFALFQSLKSSAWRKMSSVVMVFAAVAIGACLAAGVHGPGDGTLIKMARDSIPGYDMIRQPTKIFCLLPMLMAWMIAVGFPEQMALGVGNCKKLLVLVVVVGCAISYQALGKISVTVCLLDHEKSAYEFVAKDASDKKQSAVHALTIPLWPGDAADTSIPIYYAHRNGIRLINGYSPVVSTNYFEGVFRKLESINQGHLTDAQVSFLLEHGIRYLFVHENMYPEKVSPFPVATLLDRLKAHPRLMPVNQTGSIRAFALLDEPETNKQQILTNRYLFPARRLNVAFKENSFVSKGFRVAPADNHHWWIRVRGDGNIRISTYSNKNQVDECVVQVSSPEWIWSIVRLPSDHSFSVRHVELTRSGPQVDAELILLSDGQWPSEWVAGQSVKIPAADFFRGGYSLADESTTKFRTNFDPDKVVFYGPGMPFTPGNYDLSVDFSGEAPPGTHLATITVKIGSDTVAAKALLEGEPFRLNWTTKSNLPVKFELRFTRVADLTVKIIRVSRMN